MLPLAACFSDIGDPVGDTTDGVSVISEYDEKFELSNGIELSLSSDGSYYMVTDCSAVTSSAAEIPASYNGIPVEVIEDLGGNKIIEALTVPESITRISGSALDSCPNLKFTEYGGARYLSSADNDYFACVAAVDRFTSSVEIHPATIVIADRAFCNLPDLTSVTFGDSVKYVGSNAFSYCKSLRTAEIPDSVILLGSSAFSGCTALESVVLGDGVEIIPRQTFFECSALTCVRFGASLKALEEYAFAECSSLTDIRLPGTVESLYNNTFESCTFLNYNYYGKELVYLPGENSEYEFLVKYVYDSFEKAVIHPDTRVIAYEVFARLDDLKEISIDGEGKHLTVSGNCLIDTESKTLVAGINTSVIPDDGSVEVIGDYAFSGMTRFSITSIPSGIKRIGSYAFSSCKGLVSLSMSPELEIIEDNAFAHCTLTFVTFGDRLESIGSYAFNNNPITELELPSSLRRLEEGAFQMNESLLSLKIAEGLTEIGSLAFAYCMALKEVSLPTSLERIGTGAFLMCHSLSEIRLPEGLKAIDQSAFCDTALTEVILPDSLQVLESVAFKGVPIVSLRINKDIVEIGRDAFVNKTLESVSYGGTLSEWQELTAGVYDMFNEGDTLTVSCSDGDIECMGVMNIPQSVWD